MHNVTEAASTVGGGVAATAGSVAVMAQQAPTTDLAALGVVAGGLATLLGAFSAVMGKVNEWKAIREKEWKDRALYFERRCHALEEALDLDRAWMLKVSRDHQITLPPGFMMRSFDQASEEGPVSDSTPPVIAKPGEDTVDLPRVD